MATLTHEIHVGQVEPERIYAEATLEGPGEVPTLKLQIRETSDMPTAVVDIVLFLWGTPNLVWDELDSIIDACVEAKKALAARVAREIKAEERCSAGVLMVNPGHGVMTSCATHLGSPYLFHRGRCEAYLTQHPA